MKKVLIAVLAALFIGCPGVGFTGNVPQDSRRTPIQVFVPDPTKSSNQTITNGNYYTLTVTGWSVVRFYSDQELKVSINSNSAYYRSYGDYYGVGDNVTSLKFTNNSGSTAYLDIEGM